MLLSFSTLIYLTQLFPFHYLLSFLYTNVDNNLITVFFYLAGSGVEGGMPGPSHGNTELNQEQQGE